MSMGYFFAVLIDEFALLVFSKGKVHIAAFHGCNGGYPTTQHLVHGTRHGLVNIFI